MYYTSKKRTKNTDTKFMAQSFNIWVKIDGEWKHLFFFSDGRVYVNGVITEASQFARWSRKLSVDEIHYLYNGGIGKSYSGFNGCQKDGLVEMYDIDEFSSGNHECECDAGGEFPAVKYCMKCGGTSK
jgi:hypothetical protein